MLDHNKTIKLRDQYESNFYNIRNTYYTTSSENSELEPIEGVDIYSLYNVLSSINERLSNIENIFMGDGDERDLNEKLIVLVEGTVHRYLKDRNI